MKYLDEIMTSNLNGVRSPAFIHYDLHEFDAINLNESFENWNIVFYYDPEPRKRYLTFVKNFWLEIIIVHIVDAS